MYAALRGATLIAVVMAAAAVLSSCDEGWVPICNCDDPPPGYRAPASPEAVIENLATSYERREIEQYVRCLHSDFIFRFFEGDLPPDLGREFWTRDEDSASVAALFESPEVAAIEFDYVASDAAPAAEPDLAGTMKVRLNPMRLVVHDLTETTYVATGDIQDLFFTRNDPDTTGWSILEWRPLSGGTPWPYEDSSRVVVYADWPRILQHYGRTSAPGR